MPELTAAELRARLAAREVLTRRLVDQHGLTRFTARRAVLAVEEGRDTPHAELVRAEAAEVLRPFVEMMQLLRERLRPVVQAWAKAMRAAADAVRAAQNTRPDDYVLAPPPAPSDRPAWQSPYGPPSRRR
ncbi:hypothetical protein [Streptomyces scabiei]|uniref:hypothetical protein n=1 Tax=Streptomyces scabiei TaxID=1930 RepID=UPI001B321CD1|nr:MULTISPECIES: hypothetical protein [Streptomyces]MBP5890628.1 hypothetical protein [Streptomyces sp. LBUM 1481]MBP5920760.1 hypothetical protein [Streptomyces sp. LBUM 1483]MDX2538864.1 hypothetical protein [Streptomyces scabiei]MDX2802688.1 hypothetical protein [Streptomyces scabiei]MDX3295016.1 hypothetical protein [Streptomyces scabiei]